MHTDGPDTQTQKPKPKPGRKWDKVANFPCNQKLCSSPPVIFISPVRLTKFKGKQLENGLQVRKLDWPHCAEVFTKAAVDKDALGSTGDKAKLMCKATLLWAPRDRSTMKSNYSEVQGEDKEWRKGS